MNITIKKLPLIITVLVLMFGTARLDALLTFTFSPYDGGASTLLTISGSSDTVQSDDYIFFAGWNVWDYFDNADNNYVQEDGLGDLSITGSTTGSLSVTQVFVDDDEVEWGVNEDDLRLWLSGTFTASESLTGTGSAVLNIDFSLFNLGSGVPTEFVGAPIKVVVSDSGAALDPLIGGTPIEGLEGWFLSNWFGAYNTIGAPWLFHAQHGFIYRDPLSTNDNMFVYDSAIGAWWWTSETMYPFIFAFNPPADNAGTDIESEWLWYFEGSSGPRSFGVVTGDSAGSFLFFGP